MSKYIGWLIVLVISFLVIAVAFTGVGLYFGIYNKIIGTNQGVSKAVGDLDSEYQRRYALIDNLVAITKENKNFETMLVNIEKEIYIKTAEAKASATKMDVSLPETVKKRIEKENSLGSIITNALDKLMVMAQHYPQISDPKPIERTKTFEALDKLRRELKELEESILFSRKSLNEYVRVYNNSILMFPSNIVASNMGMKQIAYFDVITEGAKEDVKIKF